MTALLEKALQRLERLSQEDQDAMASQILDSLDDDDLWARSFRESGDTLERLADEALEEHKRCETRPLEELLDEVANDSLFSRTPGRSAP